MQKKQDFSDTNLVKINLITLLYGSIVFAILTGLYYAVVQFSFANSMIAIISAAIVLTILLFVKNGCRIQMATDAFIIYMNFILLPVSWLTTYGSKGPMPFYSLLFIVISSMLVSKKIEYFVLGLTVIEVSLLWFFESRYISSIILLSSSYNIAFNVVSHYFIAGTLLGIFVHLIRKNTMAIQSKLEKYSIIDELTLLHNRRFFFSALTALQEESMRTPKKFIVYMMDVDNLKKVNDFYGHQAGDEVLHKLGEIISKNIRSYDIGARYGGDEFAIILVNADSEAKKSIISRIENDFYEYARKYENVQLGLISGSSENTCLSVEEIVHEADQVLYANKHSYKPAAPFSF